MAAEQDDVLAQDMLASFYCSGSWAEEGDPNDNAEAVKWSRKAAENCRMNSQVNLGIMYFTGKMGMPVDYAEAMKWFRKAAEQNSDYAQFKLGEMYYKGQGVSVNYPEAIKWYRKAAEQNYDITVNRDAQFKLSDMYYKGEGVPRDYVQAYMWLAIVALRARASIIDASGTDSFEKLVAKMTPAQIIEAKQLAQEWMTNHAS